MAHLYLVRHGQTFLNQMNRMQGITDSALTERGQHQATTLGKNLAQIPFQAVFSSDLGRAKQTTQLIQDQLPNHLTPEYRLELREVNFGEFDAMPIDQVWADITTGTEMHTQNDIIKHGGMKKVRDLMVEHDHSHLAESYPAVLNRWQAFLQELQSHHFDTGDNILVVSHGTLIRTICEHYGAKVYRDDDSRAVPANGSYSRLDLAPDGTIKLAEFNVTKC
ncbi:histidine phosphatase family protein [Limosilactobacillus caecicola]|uniref:histidine phosphatase family protein n=1 Tax=Limosilactobacillus caecicola TaxID=2941332 RepID=UPI0020424667|nr:histidine phosphatase family protein [Limosilactobacillus caecicola]